MMAGGDWIGYGAGIGIPVWFDVAIYYAVELGKPEERSKRLQIAEQALDHAAWKRFCAALSGLLLRIDTFFGLTGQRTGRAQSIARGDAA